MQLDKRIFHARTHKNSPYLPSRPTYYLTSTEVERQDRALPPPSLMRIFNYSLSTPPHQYIISAYSSRCVLLIWTISPPEGTERINMRTAGTTWRSLQLFAESLTRRRTELSCRIADVETRRLLVPGRRAPRGHTTLQWINENLLLVAWMFACFLGVHVYKYIYIYI